MNNWDNAYISCGNGHLSVIFSDNFVEVRKPKNKTFLFRGRVIEDLDGTDFWELSKEEIRYIQKETKIVETSRL